MSALIVSHLMSALESKFEVVLGGDLNLILLIDTDFFLRQSSIYLA